MQLKKNQKLSKFNSKGFTLLPFEQAAKGELHSPLCNRMSLHIVNCKLKFSGKYSTTLSHTFKGGTIANREIK